MGGLRLSEGSHCGRFSYAHQSICVFPSPCESDRWIALGEPHQGLDDSVTKRRPVTRPAETRIADGVACSVPETDALEIIWRHVARVVMVTDDEIATAMRILFDDTHNVAEGAGAAALAAILQERGQLSGKRVAAVLSGANVDRDLYREVLGGV